LWDVTVDGARMSGSMQVLRALDRMHATASAYHPTVKPRALLEDALLDVSNRGDVVIDCFAGSGSMLLAAEAVGRRCRAIEIDGPYCGVALRRWEAMSGCSAVLRDTGETFAVVAERRFAGPACGEDA